MSRASDPRLTSGLVATLLLRDRSGIPLGPDHEDEQALSPVRGLTKV